MQIPLHKHLGKLNMSTLQYALTLRTKKIGILMTDARRIARQSEDACARIMNVDLAEYHEYETGQRMPSLPQLEVLAFFLDVPLDHFWGTKAKSEEPQFSLNTAALIPLRQKVIGITIRQLRQMANISLEEFAEKLEVDPVVMKQYELGDQPLSLPLLEQMLAYLNENISIVADRHGQIGKWYKQQKTVDSVTTYPDDIQDFVTKSINEPYLELARRLSEMDAAKLRAIAEGLLEITY
jgi:transcriptional regulator with XRE-family HTH domain